MSVELPQPGQEGLFKVISIRVQFSPLKPQSPTKRSEYVKINDKTKCLTNLTSLEIAKREGRSLFSNWQCH